MLDIGKLVLNVRILYIYIYNWNRVLEEFDIVMKKYWVKISGFVFCVDVKFSYDISGIIFVFFVLYV